MKISELMTRDPFALGPDRRMAAAAEEMRLGRILHKSRQTREEVQSTKYKVQRTKDEGGHHGCVLECPGGTP